MVPRKAFHSLGTWPPVIHGRAADGADQQRIWFSADRLDQTLTELALPIGQSEIYRASGAGDPNEPWIS